MGISHFVIRHHGPQQPLPTSISAGGWPALCLPLGPPGLFFLLGTLDILLFCSPAFSANGDCRCFQTSHRCPLAGPDNADHVISRPAMSHCSHPRTPMLREARFAHLSPLLPRRSSLYRSGTAPGPTPPPPTPCLRPGDCTVTTPPTGFLRGTPQVPGAAQNHFHEPPPPPPPTHRNTELSSAILGIH